MLRELLNRQPQSLELTQFLLLYILDYAPALGRAHDRPSLDALTIDTAPLLERFRAGPLGGHAAARGPRTLAAFGEGYRQMGDKRRACYWFGESVAAWRQIEGSTGIAPRDRPLEAATVKEYAGCRGGAAE
jgi:hypothetical protein